MTAKRTSIGKGACTPLSAGRALGKTQTDEERGGLSGGVVMCFGAGLRYPVSPASLPPTPTMAGALARAITPGPWQLEQSELH